MRTIRQSIFAVLWVAIFGVAMTAQAQRGAHSSDTQAETQQIFELANQARAQAGVGRLQWDQALAEAAMQHCQLMAAEGAISHRYQGEPDLSARTAAAGASFNVIEENVATGPSGAGIHDEWMHSPGHRANLLSPSVNRVGIAVVAARGILYAVADYSHGVEKLTPPQVEARVAALLRRGGVQIARDPSLARQACETDDGIPSAPGEPTPKFVMRFQNSDLSRLPQELSSKLASGRFHQAAVGSCEAQVSEGPYTAYRVAVLLY